MEETLNKIKKLLILAQDKAATPGEVEAAMKAASRLQRSAGVTDEQIRKFVHSSIDGSIHIDIGAITKKILYVSDKLTRWPTWCAMAAVKAVGAKLYLIKANIIAYGLASDCEVASKLFDFALSAMDKQRRSFCLNYGYKFGSPNSKTWADGFCRGLIEAANRASNTQEEETVPILSAERTALVVVSSNALEKAKENALVNWSNTNLNLKGTRASFSQSKGEQAAFNHGFQKGSSTSLSRNTIK